MPENKIPYKFDDCVTITSPFNKGDEDFIRTYRNIEEDNSSINTFEERVIIEGYLYAAKLITESICSNYKEPTAIDDQLAIPLLSIYFCDLEFCLKFLIKKLKEHQKYCICTTNKLEEADEYHHDLCKLVDSLMRFFSNKNKLHEFCGFKEIFNFIKDFYNFGITMESVRYYTDKNKDIFDLHNKSIYISPLKLYKCIEHVVGSIISYIEDEDFFLCKNSEFTEEKLDELNYVKSVMLENKNIISDHNHKKASNKNNNPFFDFSSVENLDGLSENLRFYDEEILIQDDKKLAALVMGLYFTHSPVTIENLCVYERWKKDDLKKKILERFHLFDKAFSRLNKHINYIEDTLKNRL